MTATAGTRLRPPSAARARRRGAALLGLLTALLAAAQLLVPTPIGLADNGDSARLTCQLQVQADVPEGTPSRFVAWVPTYRPQDPDPPPCVGLYSSQLPLLQLAKALSPGEGVLDLRVAGLLHAALLGALVAAVVLGLPGPARLRLLCGALLALVLLDTGRVVYLATAYSEPASLLGLLLLLAVALRAFRSPPRLLTSAALCLSAVPLVLSKPQNVPAAGVVAAAVLLRHALHLRRARAAAPGEDRRARAGAAAGAAAAAVALALTGVAMLRAVPPQLVEPNTYNIVFFEVLAFSDDPAEDARALGLDPALARWAGTDVFNPPNALSDPAFAGFYDRVGTAEVVLFYAARPDRALELFARSARASAVTLPDYLGTERVGSGAPDFAQPCRLCTVTPLAALLRPAAPVLLPLLWLGALLAGSALVRRTRAGDRALGATTLLLTVTTGALFGTAVLGSGQYELVKHLFLPSVGSTLLLPLGLACLARLRARYLPVTGPGSTGTGASPGGSRSST